MKLSIRLVSLLAGVATGSPANVDKRQEKEGAEALKAYCGEGGFEAGTVTEKQDGYERFTGTCVKKDGSNAEKFSVQLGVQFCQKLNRRFRGSGGPYHQGDYVVICGPKEDVKQPDETNGRVLLNQIIADSQGDPEKIKIFLEGLSRDAPATLTSLRNALKAPASTTPGGLGGGAGAGAGLLATIYDFITVNAAEGGLIGPETTVGQWLRTNPIYGRAGTQPSPFGFDACCATVTLPPTQLCVPFKDESRWYWREDVKRCRSWHDRQKCDASYAYDAATEAGKEQLRVCQEEGNKDEASCVRPKLACQSFDDKTQQFKFEYCMADDNSSREVCKANGWVADSGRDKTPDEVAADKEAQKKQEEANCVSPRWVCRNIKGDFVTCIDGSEQSQTECKSNQWFPEPAPKRSDKQA
ncbi:hypothetical protein MGU_10360 [Metarhizium guizhouense ARSEF 977]|uniref:Heat-labile enterotoxin IIA, A chain n=1 Tax=Metarhizium guizhouense (strain ARSEF 977) TaxID=1276136 RepID=A0A0B4G6M2_METGA|nr:hypothetical protein MGU_10360 [Metarhizium guizhouense ARSEF 977]